MLAASTIDPAAPPEEPPQIQSAVGRTPFYLHSQGQPLLAWLHTRRGAASLNHGVIVCPPIGYEQLHAHRGLRHLADELASRGFPVLRFDWHGTGDSAGSDEDPTRCATWLANLHAAADWMRDHVGHLHLSAVGLRLGALLAAKALEEQPLDNFVLWAPVISGRSYVREMQLIDRTAETQPRDQFGNPEDIEAGGLVLARETAAELATWNLLKLRPKCRSALIVARSDMPADYRLADHFSSLGIAAEQVTAPGVAEMFVEPHYNRVPHTAITEIASWLCRQVMSDPQTERLAVPIAGPDEAAIWHGPAAITNADAQAGDARAGDAQAADGGQLIREQAFRIHENPDLFGVLSKPQRPDRALPIIVLANSGSVHHVGTGRLYVALARQLTAAGFYCLRMDLCGLGDSVAADHADENNPYPATTFRDLEITLSQVRTRLGIERSVLLGLCSGAYAAFQSAAQLSDPALVESVLINPLTYFWRDGMTLDAPSIAQVLQQHRCLARALEPKKLWKLFTGRTQIGMVGAARLLAQWFARQLPRRPCDAIGTELPPAAGPAHPRKEDLPGDLARVAAAGRHLAMFFSKSDPGYSLLSCQARRQVSRLRKLGKLEVTFIKDADHTFSRRAPRRELVEAIVAHFRRRYQQPE